MSGPQVHKGEHHRSEGEQAQYTPRRRKVRGVSTSHIKLCSSLTTYARGLSSSTSSSLESFPLLPAGGAEPAFPVLLRPVVAPVFRFHRPCLTASCLLAETCILGAIIAGLRRMRTAFVAYPGILFAAAGRCRGARARAAQVMTHS